MKRVFIIFLAIAMMSFLPLQAYAASDSDDGKLKDVNYETIEEEILSRNPTAKTNENLLQNLLVNLDKDTINDSIDDLEQAEKAIDFQIANQTAAKQKIMNSEGLVGDETLVGYVKTNFESMLGIYDYYISVLNSNKDSIVSQIESLEKQKEDRSQTLTKMKMQTSMSNYQLVWAAENLMAGLSSISYNIDDLSSKLDLLRKRLVIAKFQQSMGMITEMNVESIELQIRESELALKQLNEQKDDVTGQINLMLGQDYDTDIKVTGVPAPEYDSIDDMDLKEDYDNALSNNFGIRLQGYQVDDKEDALEDTNSRNEEKTAYNNLDNEEIKLEDEKMKFEKAFSEAFQGVKDKEESLEYEKFKLENEEKNLSISQLKYDLGMISSMDLDSARSSYNGQSIKVSTGEDELWKAYRKYEWMMRGLTL